MADGKNIEIKIAATGGDQAAAEFSKPKQAIESLIVSEEGLAKKRAMFLSAAEAEVAEVERLVASVKKLEVAQNDLAESKNTVTKKGVQMGTGMQNVGYQVQDLAVQIGSGTSAFRALGQQLPQLLSGFGPLGITLGTISAVALPLAGAMFDLGNATEDAGEKASEAAEKIKKLSETRIEKAVAAALKENAAYLQSLDDENAAVTRNNEAVQRSIDLIKEQQNAKVAIQNAQAGLDLATLDADDTKTEAQKIAGRAAINRRVERESFENEKVQGEFRINAANNEARGATGDSNRAAADLEAMKQRLESLKEEEKIKAKIFAADRAKEKLPQIEKNLADAEAAPSFTGSPAADAAISAQRSKDLKRFQADKLAAQTSIDAVTNGDREQLAQLQGVNKKSGTIDQTQKAIADQEIKTKDLEDKAALARENALNTRKAEEIKIEGRFEVSKLNLKTSQITEGYGVKEAAKEAEEKKKRDEPKPLDAGKVGQGIEKLIPEGVSRNFRASVEKASAALQDGGTAAELKEMATLLAQLGGSTNSAVANLKSEIAAAKSQISQLQAQIKNRPNR